MPLNVAYTISPSLKTALEQIESLRKDILLAPLPPKIELRLRWEATIHKIYWSLTLSNNMLSKKEMLTLLTMPSKKKLSSQEQDVINYKKALDYLAQNWLVSQKLVTPKTLLNLYEIACPHGKLSIPEANLKQLLDYLQTSPEHPIIQSAIIQIQLSHLAPFTHGNGRLSRLAALLFLYKHAYDFKGLLVLEEYWRHNLTLFTSYTEQTSPQDNLTLWLESFTEGIITQLEKVTNDIKSHAFHVETPTLLWELNQRQKEILILLEQPNLTITNKKAQHLFKISQITASRDLTHLTSLGLLFSHGKGRSVYYTKV